MDPKPNIVVLDGATLNPGDNPWDEVAALGAFALHDRTPEEFTVERARGADIVLTNKTRLPAAVLDRLPDCRFVAVLATGYDVVDVAHAGARGIPVSNVPGYGVESVAQFVIAQLLALCRRVETHDSLVRSGEWTRCGEFTFWDTPQVELAGKTLGVVGFGAIGRRVAQLGAAFGMNVLAHAPRPKEPLDAPGFAFVGLEELFERSDVVSLHCPLTKGNDSFVDARLLGLMRPGGFLVNTARGRLVNEADLARALNSGHLAGAALDVLAVEPPDPANPLLEARNCLITPHMAWASLTARKRLMSITAANIRAFLAGQPQNLVNADYLTETA
ncbi:Glycerate dehydrogenase [Fundidesulfovibrio magnetotacticus]|uniref:Glycerate dehydrogenase n=1 Tax=Fundidesulfovibrio magnetotacticus TaxID=2730080 RepID=A0A6V8LS41_9BACT|nr:D-2-hydroxyacid dehydrogenase [Fundidesulfovibrio magnetotacticus]GFK93381.1 Glycerate dehydrogenase [Fundidesulfovibrio magnetotacticus]